MKSFKITFTDGSKAQYDVSNIRSMDEFIAEIEEMSGKEVESWTEIN